MAAAVVPSRARAAARPPVEDDALTYVRLTLVIDTLRGPHLHAPPAAYVFRWHRAGKLVKSTPPRSLQLSESSVFAQKMALYARVRRHGPTFISDDPAEPLHTDLELCFVSTPTSEPVHVASVPFDLAHYLNHLAQSGTKTLSAALPLSPHADATFTLTIKALGENHLTPYVAPPEPPRTPLPQRTQPAAVHPADDDEATAAVELERLRADVREREGRLVALETSTTRLDAAVRDHSHHAETAVPAADFAALQVRIATLEEQHTVAERERIEAERKVAAHVAHAAKIKRTYNQLAAWYNNLREEHTELRKKLPESETSSADMQRNLPEGVATTHEADYKILEKERDELQQQLEQERSEKKQMHSRNSQLMEAKARTLAELREQWESTEGTLAASQKSSEEQAQRMKNLESIVDSLKAELAAKESLVVERAAELAMKDRTVRAIEASQAEAVEKARAEAVMEAKGAVHQDLEHLKQAHEQELRKLVTESAAAAEATLEHELRTLRDSHTAEIASIQKRLEEEVTAKHEEALEGVKREYEAKIQERGEQIGRSVQDTESAVKTIEEKMQVVQNEKAVLEEKLESLAKARLNEIEGTREIHQEEVKGLLKMKESVEGQFKQLRDKLEADNAASQEAAAKEKQRSDALEDKLKKTLAEIEAIQKAKEAASVSPRQVSVDDVKTTETISILEGQNSKLKTLLKAESDRRSEAMTRLSEADREHDQIEAMVVQLRAERDEALSILKRSKELVPNPNVNIGRVHESSFSSSQESEVSSLLEERDKAIRELFRVRKGMNKEIKRLKKENQDLSLQTGTDDANRDTSHRELPSTGHEEGYTALREERDAAVLELQKIRSELSHSTSSNAGDGHVAERSGDLSSHVQQRIAELEAEMVASAAKNQELEQSLAVSREEHSRALDGLRNERCELEKQLSQSQKELSVSLTNKSASEVPVEEHSSTINALTQEIAALNQAMGNIELERDEERKRASSVLVELESLKDSLAAASSSSSSAENLLRDAQREVAEGKSKIDALEGETSQLLESIARLEAVVKDQSSTSCDLGSRLKEAETIMNEEKARNLSEKKEEASRFEVVLQELQSKNSSLAAKLAAEKDEKDGLQNRLNEVGAIIVDLRAEVRRLEDDCRSKSENLSKLSAEREEALLVLAETRKQLDMTESRLSEQQEELNEAKSMIKSAESSRELHQIEASEAGGKSMVISEELVALRAELKQTQRELQAVSRDHEVEVEKNLGIVKGLEKEKETMSTQLGALQVRFESTEDELRVIKDSYATLESVLQRVQEKATRLSRSSTEKNKECSAMSAEISELRSEHQQSRSQYQALVEQHERAREELSTVLKETGVLQGEKRSFSERIKSLEAEIGIMRERLTFMQEESEEALVSERAHSEKEAKKSAELRKDLRSARARAEALEAEMEQVRASNTELNALKENGDSRDGEVLNDLINTRMELAYAQEETIRLRNRLKKLVQSGQGSSSFEY